MAAIWYYKLMGETYGPFTANELREKAAAGEITPEAWVRKGHDAKWVSADRVSGLFAPPSRRTAVPRAKAQAQPPPVFSSSGADDVRRDTTPPKVPSTKRCPFCAEEIAAAARKCKHCGEFLDGATASSISNMHTATTSGPEQTIWEGHPSALYYLGHWILGVLLLPVGIGVILIVYAILDQKTKLFTHTNKRVTSNAGIIFSRTTHEVNLSDVRSISMEQNLFERLFGLGTVQVCSAGHAGIEVEFSGIENPAKVRDQIRQSKDQIR